MAIRENHVLLTSLTMLAAGGQLPSCSSVEDVKHMYQALNPAVAEAEAADAFKSTVFKVTESLAPQANDAMHR